MAVRNDPPALLALRPPATPGRLEHRDALEIPPNPAVPEEDLLGSIGSCLKRFAIATGKCLFSLLQAIVKFIYRVCPEEVLGEEILPDAAAAAAHRLARIQTKIETWKNPGFYSNFEYPCQITAIVKIYQSTAPNNPIVLQYAKTYREKNTELFTQDITAFSGQITAALPQGYNRQDEIRMFICAAHKNSDETYLLITSEHHLQHNATTGGPTSYEEAKPEFIPILCRQEEVLHGINPETLVTLQEETPARA